MNATPQQMSQAGKAVEDFLGSLGRNRKERKPVRPHVVEVRQQRRCGSVPGRRRVLRGLLPGAACGRGPSRGAAELSRAACPAVTWGGASRAPWPALRRRQWATRRAISVGSGRAWGTCENSPGRWHVSLSQGSRVQCSLRGWGPFSVGFSQAHQSRGGPLSVPDTCGRPCPLWIDQNTLMRYSC